MIRFDYVRADAKLLGRIWEKNIAANPGDGRWVRWRDEYLSNHAEGRSCTFLVLADGEPVGEGTLLFESTCSAVGGRKCLADGVSTANVNALRIEKRFEGQGHISRMVRLMEKFARERGFERLTIGVEECETRNRAIYRHWGYDDPVMSEVEDGETVLYYAKRLEKKRARMDGLQMISVREKPEWTERIIAFFQRHWATENSMMVYDDCIRSCVGAQSPLPQWFVLADGEKIVAGCGLIPNDFISRMDLMPWLAALYVEEEYRGRGLGGRLVLHTMEKVTRLGFDSLYLCTDHVGYYEKFGFEAIAEGYHPWGESSRIYRARMQI